MSYKICYVNKLMYTLYFYRSVYDHFLVSFMFPTAPK
jgi:hypothetical protein